MKTTPLSKCVCIYIYIYIYIYSGSLYKDTGKYRDISPITMENQVERNMENEMETGT